VQYFVAVAEELHFGRAAERLHIAQPSLSHQIRRLEQQLGVTLLDRTSRQVELTEAGRALLSEGRHLLAHSERTTRLVRSISAERLTVGFFGSAGSALLPDLLRVFSGEHPSADVSVRELLLDQIGELLSGGVDVAFTRLLPGQAEVELEVIAREPRVVALPGTAFARRAGDASVQRPPGGELHHEPRRRSCRTTEAVAGRTSPPRPARARRGRGGERSGDTHPGRR
jgi:DNA-binding transcriptional LysR family regulator